MGVKTICNFILVRTKNNGRNCGRVYGVFLKVTCPGSSTDFCGEINTLPK